MNTFTGKIGICIQARLSSTRLPGKILFTLGDSGLSSLSLMLKRLQNAFKNIPALSDNIYVLTTESACDEAIIQVCEEMKVNSFRGSQDDVLSRFYNASIQHRFDVVIRLTSDCPFVDPLEILRVLDIHISTKADYTTNTFQGSTLVDGFDVEIFNFNPLSIANEKAKLPSEREHVTFYFRENNGFSCTLADPNFNYPINYRLTLDTAYDFKVISKMVELLGDNILKMQMHEIINEYRLKKFDRINSHLEKNHGWKSAFLKDKKISY